jgi:hypothetical protein
MASFPFALHFIGAADDQSLFVRFVKGLAAQCSHRLGHGAFLTAAFENGCGHGLVACTIAAIMASVLSY